MKIKFLPSIFFFLLLFSSASAQEKYCGNEDLTAFGFEKDEATLRRIEANERFTQQWISENQTSVALREVITIPVVVHILYKEEADNFTDLEIEAQIDGLTADFRKMNNNANSIPAEFRPLAADIEFEFCLSTVDPEGKPTNGIVRRRTWVDTFGAQFLPANDIHYQNLGGSDAWDTEHYVNIWVGTLPGSTAGYATLPGEASEASMDGIVISKNSFGFFCSPNSGLSLGRTLTHEMGHYFNLLHIWGDASGCLTDDLVNDTPLQDVSSSGCPAHPQITCESNDMFMNFMDYSDDACLAMFTEGQKLRMRAALEGPRKELKNSLGCGNPGSKDLTLTPDDISLFPNPANECVHIDLDLDSDLPIKMAIFNNIGQQVFANEVFVKDLRTFDLSRYGNGIYIIYFESNNQVASKKLIIDR